MPIPVRPATKYVTQNICFRYQGRTDMSRSRVHFLLVCFALLVLPMSVIAAPATVDKCAECHGVDGMGSGRAMVPVIAGIPAGHIEEAIYAYVDGARRCIREPRMCETVAALSELEVTEVAEYYAGLVRGSPQEEFNSDLAAEGEVLHQQYCSICHLPPDHEDVKQAVGIPLHGQRSEYLRFAIEAYFAGDRVALVETMAERIQNLQAGDLGALVNYYSSYRSVD
jgi:cytochrome c553